MTVYDYLTPFEDQVQAKEHLSRELPLLHPDTEVQATKSSTSIDTPYFDVGPAFFSPPQPFNILPLTSELPSSHEKVPELSHRASTQISSSDVSPASSPCKSCGLIPAAKGLIPEHDCCHICPDIARERECPDIHVPSEMDEAQAQSRRSSGHHRRRHSLLYEGAPLRDELNIPEEHSNCHSHVDNPLEEECSMLEQESNMLGRESNQLEYEASPLGQTADVLEKPDSTGSLYNTDSREQQSEVKSRQEWEKHYRLQKKLKRSCQRTTLDRRHRIVCTYAVIKVPYVMHIPAACLTLAFVRCRFMGNVFEPVGLLGKGIRISMIGALVQYSIIGEWPA